MPPVFCRNGGRVVDASRRHVAATNAADPVYDDLERDETTKVLIQRIREMKQALPNPSTVAPCGPTSSLHRRRRGQDRG